MDRISDYDVKFSAEVPVLTTNEPEEYVLGILGKIFCRAHDEAEAEVGEIHAKLIQVGRALNDGYLIDDVFDAHQETLDLYVALYDQESQELKEDVAERFETIGVDLLYLSKIEVAREHRGFGLGLAVVSRCVDVWEPSEGLVVCKPFPLQFDSAHGDDSTWMNKVGAHSFPKDKRTATRKLAAYWRSLGFAFVEGTEYAALCTTRRRPNLEAALGARRATSRIGKRKPV
jgi:hypothetical protein